MTKTLVAFLLGVLVTVVAVTLLPTHSPEPSAAASASCAPSAQADEWEDHRALESRLDSLEREISSDAGDAPSRPAPEAPQRQRR